MCLLQATNHVILKQDCLRLQLYIDETEVNQSDVSHVFPFHDTLFSSNRGKVYKTRAERRCRQKNRQDYRVSHEELIRDQKNDPDIQKWSDQVKPIYKRVISGVLCRRWGPLNNLSESCDQIVLPKGQHHHALRLAHDIPMAGHLGHDRTLERLCKHFWWPGINHDVAEYCRSCPECQRVSKCGPKAPMVPMPIIGEPFERIAMDLIGPLFRTATGKQYVLVYATRYPEAFAMSYDQ